MVVTVLTELQQQSILAAAAVAQEPRAVLQPLQVVVANILVEAMEVMVQRLQLLEHL